VKSREKQLFEQDRQISDLRPKAYDRHLKEVE
jgi:hypothetical protein